MGETQNTEIAVHQRFASIDIAKGIGIVLVVIGHLIGVTGYEASGLTYAKSFLYQFHVPLFFFLSGLFFNPDEKWKPFLIKKLKRLYLPFVIANLFFLLCDVILRAICSIPIVPLDDFKHAVKIILQLAVSPMGGATWFLIALLRATIFFKLLRMFCRNDVALLLICICIGVCGMYFKIGYTVSASMVAIMYYCFGYFSKNGIKRICTINWPVLLLIFAVLSVLLVILKPYNQVDVSASIYSSRILAIVGSVVGIVSTLVLSELIAKLGHSGWIEFIGRNTMSVLIGHFAAFKLVTCAIIISGSIPVSAILSHPCYKVSGLWWLVYLVTGLLIPTFFSYIKTKSRVN